MSDQPAADRWEQLNRCPVCGVDMQRAAQVGEQIGLYYRCPDHGRFRYSWDRDELEPVPDAGDQYSANASSGKQ